jgi:hypothetical protein
LYSSTDVLAERLVVAEEVHDHGVVDDEIDRHQRVDLLGIAAELLHRVAHRGEIDHRRHAGEILHQHARRAEAISCSSCASSAISTPRRCLPS